MATPTHDVIATCPVCSGQLAVTRLHCGGCGTTLEGRFGVGRFGRLDKEQLALLESFLRSRGNLRDMERELGISYPTVRNRVEALVRALGLADGDAPAAPEPAAPPTTPAPDPGFIAAERRRVLERLARNELTPEDAAAILRALGGTEARTDA
ncbi:MAG: DUF2089 domain-containing protein [Chloroflexota bacterium]